MKKQHTKLTLILLLVLPALSSRAQYIVKQADQQYNLFNYSKAVELYQKAYKKDSTLHNAERLANSYRLMHDYANAEKWYAITTRKTGSKIENILRYAEALKNNLRYAEAKAQYTRYYTLSRPTDTARLNFWTSACDSAMRWMKNPVAVTLKNEASLNSHQSDWGAVVYNNQILFTSDRLAEDKDVDGKKKKSFLRLDYHHEGPGKDIYGWTGRHYLKLYSVPQNAATMDALQRFPLPTRADYHVGPPSFTADGSEMYFSMTRIPKSWEGRKDSIKTVNIEIYTSKKNPVTQRWEEPVPFRYNNVQYWSVGDPFITPDGKTLYFVSDMTGTLGGTDIWYCTRGVDGDWSKPVNFLALNTEGNERTPVMTADSIFYFSSDGAKGMGGLDVFRAVPRANGYQKQNMGYPFNSPQDDFAFLLLNSTTGYLSSNRQGGAGSDDIYSFVYQPAPTYVLTGIVFNKSNRQRIANSTVTLVPAKGRELKAQSDANGAYKFTLQGNSEYRIKGAKEGYLSDNDERPISTAGLPPEQEIRKNFYLEKIVLKKAIRLENIYYDLDKADIRPDAAVELDKLIKILKDNPTIEVELGSHTDSRGDDDYNKDLSERRANAAVDYITTVGGIDEYRIIARGYGESRLLNRCGNGVKCSEADHQLNRRTEFTIIKY